MTISPSAIEKDLRISRRALLGGAAAVAAGGLVLSDVTGKSATPVEATGRVTGRRHLVWVWQFSSDGEPNVVGVTLRDYGVGIVLKTHDGIEWMSKYDKSAYAVSGKPQIEVLANYYEDAGIPFHAWCVVKGTDPIREARMAAEVLSAGVRSLFIDLEPHDGFWSGTPADAVAFGNELRRLQPNGWVVTSVDPRPWVLERIPMQEFAAFSNELAPQLYWRTFNTTSNYTRYAEKGIPTPPEGITPEFLIDTTWAFLAPYNLPINVVGQGATEDATEWRRFINRSYELGGFHVGVWRYGVAGRGVLPVLQEIPPRVPPEPAYEVYVVQPGDTLAVIAGRFGVTVDEIVALNGIADPNFISVGQELRIPIAGGSGVAYTAPAPAPAPSSDAPAPTQTYTVAPGDTLSGIAARFGTTIDALVGLNSISDPNAIWPGQVLRVS